MSVSFFVSAEYAPGDNLKEMSSCHKLIFLVNFQEEKQGYIRHFCSHEGLKGTIENQTYNSLNIGSLTRIYRSKLHILNIRSLSTHSLLILEMFRENVDP